MVRNILVIDRNPLLRLETIMKFIGGSSFISFRESPEFQHCNNHEVFDKKCLLCQRLSNHQIDIKEEKQSIMRFKHIVAQSNRLYDIYKRCQNLDILESIIRKSLGIAIDKNTRTLEKLRNIIRLKKSSIICAKLNKTEKECLDNLWIIPHCYIIFSDQSSINKLLDNLDILDMVNNIDNPFIHIFYELEDISQKPENLLEYEVRGENGWMTVSNI